MNTRAPAGAPDEICSGAPAGARFLTTSGSGDFIPG
jgi:hypothetical protein